MLVSQHDIKRIEFYIVIAIGLYGACKIQWLCFSKKAKVLKGEEEDVLLVGVINIIASIVCLALMIT